MPQFFVLLSFIYKHNIFVYNILKYLSTGGAMGIHSIEDDADDIEDDEEIRFHEDLRKESDED